MKTMYKLLPLLLLVGCSTLKPNKFDQAKAKEVRKVAILGLTVQQDAPKDAWNLSAITNKGINVQDSKELQQMSNQVYEKLANRIGKSTGWKVVPRATVASSPEYKDFFKSKMEGNLRRTDFAKGDVLWPEKIVDWYNFGSLEHTKRAELAKKMGADGYVLARVFQTLDQSWGIGNLVGKGDFSYKSEILMEAYSNSSDQPIWKIVVSGEPSRNTAELPKDLTVYGKRATVGLESANSLITNIVVKK